MLIHMETYSICNNFKWSEGFEPLVPLPAPLGAVHVLVTYVSDRNKGEILSVRAWK